MLANFKYEKNLILKNMIDDIVILLSEIEENFRREIWIMIASVKNNSKKT